MVPVFTVTVTFWLPVWMEEGWLTVMDEGTRDHMFVAQSPPHQYILAFLWPAEPWAMRATTPLYQKA